MSFIIEDDDDYTDNLELFNTQESIIDKTQLKTLQIKNKRSRCYMYEEIKRDIFLQWWKTFSWAKTHTNQDKKKEKHMYWENDKKSNIWKHFKKDVIVENDNSKIVCKRCELVLKHSFADFETHTTKMHLSSKQCVKIAKVEDLSQLTIVKSWKKIRRFDFSVRRLVKRLVEIFFFCERLSSRSISRKINKKIFKCD
jgi:hypothetical protein